MTTARIVGRRWMRCQMNTTAEKVNIEELDEDRQKVFRILIEAGTKVLEQMEEEDDAD